MELDEFLAEFHRRLEVEAEIDYMQNRWGSSDAAGIAIRVRQYQENLIDQLVHMAAHK